VSKILTSLQVLPFALLTLSLSAPAFAEKPDRPYAATRWARSQGGRFGFEVDVLSNSHQVQSEGGSVKSSRLGIGVTVVGQFKVFAGLYLDVELPLAYGDITGPQSTDLVGGRLEGSADDSAFVFGNPTLGLHYAGNLLPRLALFGGLTGSIPVIEPDRITALAAAANFPARGYFDAHRLLLQYASLRTRAGVEIKLADVLHYRSDLTWLLAFPTGDSGDTRVVIELGNELELRAPGGIGFGFRLQTALPLSSNDILQTAAEPFLSYEPPGKGSYFRAGYLVALDNELGFGFEAGKVATFRVAFGGKY
jgi:hypothetical protein